MIVIPPVDLTAASRITSTSVSDPTGAASAWVSGTLYEVGDLAKISSSNLVYRCVRNIITATSTISPDADIVSSLEPSWVEDGPPIWSSGTAYIVGQYVTYAVDNKVYYCLADNTNVIPTSDITKWTLIGPSNKYSMFDISRNNTTKAASNITVVLTPGVTVNSLALLGLKNVSQVNVTVTVSGTPTYTNSKSLNNRVSTSWYEYFFVPIVKGVSAIFTDIPSNLNNVITIELVGTNIECAGCVVGKKEFLGTTQRNATNDILNFSSVTRDIFGNATLVPRRSIPKTNQVLFLDKSLVDRARSLRDILNAVPAVWVGIEDETDPYYESFIISGFYKTFTIEISNPIAVLITLELEEI